MVYQEIKPSKLLSSHIDSYWFFESTNEAEQEMPILPDCCMDIIYNLSNDNIFVCGVMTTTQTVPIKPDQKFFGIRFMPGVLPALLNVPADELKNKNIPLQEISRHFFEKISPLRNLSQTTEMVRVCDSIFEQETKHVDIVTKLFSCSKIEDTHRNSVKDLSQRMKMSVRHLERLFAKYIGLTPKHFLKIRRFQSFHSHLQGTRGNLATTSLLCGYADQSHMNKEYKQLTSATPTSKKMSRFYKN